MKTQDFHHALKIDEETCIGCTHCMQVCPTEAIRVRNGKAKLFPNRCVDCGYCYRECPVEAIYVEQDDFERIFDYKYRVALVPAIFIGQFPRDVITRKIYSSLTEEGFTHVYEAEHSTGLLKEEMRKLQDELPETKPLISSFCPAIVRLIQVKFPSLVDHIMLLKSPLELAALSYKHYLIEEEGAKEEEIGIFSVTPCAAKIAAVKSPVGEKYTSINGVINMDFLFNRVYTRMQEENKELCAVPKKEQLTDKEMMWSLTHGESIHAKGRSLAVDGIHNVISFLQRLESEDDGSFDFLELRACDKSCAGGILTANNRFLATERMENRARRYRRDIKSGKKFPPKSLEKYVQVLKDNINVGEIAPRSMDKLDDDMKVALKKMERIRNLMCFLPAIDCGGCGSPSCNALAEDIVQGRAAISNCVFIQKLMVSNGKLSDDHAVRIVEKVWGKGKLDKDCSKKGAKNEGF